MDLATTLTNALNLSSDHRPTVLEIDLSLGLLGEAPQDPLTALRSRMTPRLPHVIAGLRHGAEDDAVVGAVIHVTPTVTAWQSEELAYALRAFRDAGKRVIAWSESFGELGPGTLPYYLATVADEIWLQPSGSLGLLGVGLEVMTIRGTLDKIGAVPQFGQRKEYKTAAEMYMSTDITEPNREMTDRIGASVTEQVIASTMSARGLSEEQVREAITASPLTAERAQELGLVDRLGFRADVYAHLRETFADSDSTELPEQIGDPIRLLFAHRYARSITHQAVSKARARRQPIIGVVEVHGGIITGRGSGPRPGRSEAASDLIVAALRAAGENDAVRAVVLRVDSPGGSYVASDAIRDQVRRLQASGRPVIASMGALAASGGYFVSMPADTIVALPSTLTGSIGVLGGKIMIKDTLAKIGVNRQSIGTAEATMFSGTRLFDDAEWQKVESWLDLVYDDFTHKAAADRELPYEQLEAVAKGRVWTGADALERGLVDRLGGLRTAIEIAAEKIGVDPDHARVQQFPQLPMLAKLKPAESSESPMAAGISGRPAGPLELLAATLGVEQTGVLTVPWRFTLT